MDALRELVRFYQAYLTAAAAAIDPSTVELIFADADMGAAYLVAPEASGLRVQAHKSSPMLRRYTLNLIVLREMSTGQRGSITIGKLSADASTEGATFSAAALNALGASALQPPQPTYRYQADDSLDRIADLYGVAPGAIADANAIRYPGRLQPGFVMHIPV